MVAPNCISVGCTNRDDVMKLRSRLSVESCVILQDLYALEEFPALILVMN